MEEADDTVEVPFGAGKPYEETCHNSWAGLLSELFARETEVKPSIAGDFCNLEVHLKEKYYVKIHVVISRNILRY